MPQKPEGVIVRKALVADARVLAELHVSCWHETYRDLAPPEILAHFDVDRRLQLWTHILAAKDANHRHVVAEVDGTAVAFGSTGPANDPVYGGRGVIKAIYVARAAQRRGIGRRLMFDLVSFLLQSGHGAAALAVLDGNARAIAFYESIGAQRIGAFTDPGPVWRSRNVVYAWDDIAMLVRRLG